MRKILKYISLLCCLISICSLTTGCGNIKMEESSEQYLGQLYGSVKGQFEEMGFKDIKTKEISDLLLDKEESDGIVTEISIDGNSKFQADDKFAKDSKVIITYHSLVKYEVKVHVDFEENWIFDKYNVKLCIDGKEKENLTHGEDTDYKCTLPVGEHEISFVSIEDEEVQGKKKIQIDSDLEVAYHISCHSSEISVEEEYIDKQQELAGNEIKMMTDKTEFIDKNYKEVVSELTQLGFKNIKEKPVYDINFGITEEYSVKNVKIDNKDDYRRGDVFKNNVKVVVSYHLKSEDNPEKATSEEKTEYDFEEQDEEKETLTADNCPELAAMLENKADTDSSYADFATKYAGREIEFDGKIAAVSQHGEYKTRFDYLIYEGDSSSGVAFQFENVNYYDFHLQGDNTPDTIGVGLNIHIIAEVDEYNEVQGLFKLKPVSTTIR